MSARRVLSAALLATMGVISVGAEAASPRRTGGRIVAREPRPHRMIHEFDVGVGLLPLDALYAGLSLGGSYTLHLSDAVALELVDFRYSANVDSGLRRRLQDLDTRATFNPEIEYIAGTGILLTPLYGKLAFFDDTVVAASTHLGINVGLAHFTDGFRFQVSAGPGVRLFFSDTVSTRLDVRGTVAFDDVLSAEGLLQINLSVAFNFGSRRAEAVDEEAEAVDVDALLDALYPGTTPAPEPEGRP